MLKKIIFGIVIGLLVSMTATGLIYAGNKDAVNKGNNKQELNKEKTTDTDEDVQDEVNEDPNVFHITASCNHGGTISPKGNQSVIKGEDSPSFIITAYEGYEIAWVRVDNAKIKNITSKTYSKTFEGIGKNHTIHAHFKKVKQPKQ